LHESNKPFIMIGVPIIGGNVVMAQKLSKRARKKRADYNLDYQKKYVKRYVFKLNTRHDRELIEILEQMDNRTAWFKSKLEEAVN